jgi:rubredoxin
MRCSFCGYEFDPDEAESACGSCPMTKGCHLVRCPHCGYEMPPEARLVKWIRKLRQRAADRSVVTPTELGGNSWMNDVDRNTNNGGSLFRETK